MLSIRKWFLIMIIFSISTLISLLYVIIPKRDIYNAYQEEMGDDNQLMVTHVSNNYSSGKWRLLSKNQQKNLSRLGRILFLDAKSPKQNQKNYSILIWNYNRYLKLRPHMQQSDPFKNCPVKNCFIKSNNTGFRSANIIIFDLQITKNLEELHKSRKNNQIWAFLIDNNPLSIFNSFKKKNLKSYNNLFNWSMTYRMDSDIPIPYGRTVLLKVGDKGFIQKYSEWNKNKKQDVLMAIIVSSPCMEKNHRWKYIKELQKYLKIDIYGKCGNKTCQSNFLDCEEISKYKFYLAFEQVNCDEYTTQNVWWYGYEKNTIPIVMGGAKKYYEQLLPPNSYINTENFASPRDVANYVIYLNHTPSDLEEYFVWKKYFKVLNEHGYFNTKPVQYCRICEALNYNSKKVYKSLNQFVNINQCHPN